MSDETNIPVHVRNLIRDRIHSIEQLETLLLVRSERTRTWSLKDIADALRFTQSAAEVALSTLVSASFVREVDVPSGKGYLYAPTNAELAALIDALDETYRTFRVETLVMISTNAISRVRSQALNTFSEAFRVRGPKKDG